MAILHEEEVRPSRNILVVVTVGGITNAAPILEIARVLHARGHSISLAGAPALVDRLKTQYPFVSRTHILHAVTYEDGEEYLSLLLAGWDPTIIRGLNAIFRAKRILDAHYPITHTALHPLLTNSSTRPDFLLTDGLCDAAIDLAHREHIPTAQILPSFPPFHSSTPSYIPGVPGFQTRTLTSEHASLLTRLHEAAFPIRALPWLVSHALYTRCLRLTVGEPAGLLPRSATVTLLNTFWGLTPSRALPPLVACVGPLLAPTYPPLKPDLAIFLGAKKRVCYIAFGTRVILPPRVLLPLCTGLALALREGHIDAVLWALRPAARKQFAALLDTHVSFGLPVRDILANNHPAWRVVPFAPQRAVLAHASTAVFLTHAGASSVSEAVWAGMPMVCLPVYGDQIGNALGVEVAGVGLRLDKNTLSARSVCEGVERLTGGGEQLDREVRRLRRMVRTCADGGAERAADLVDGVLWDWEGRGLGELGGSANAMGASGRRKGVGRSLCMETSDQRMNFFKARGWDLWLLGLGIGLGVVGLVVGVVKGVNWARG